MRRAEAWTRRPGARTEGRPCGDNPVTATTSSRMRHFSRREAARYRGRWAATYSSDARPRHGHLPIGIGLHTSLLSYDRSSGSRSFDPMRGVGGRPVCVYRSSACAGCACAHVTRGLRRYPGRAPASRIASRRSTRSSGPPGRAWRRAPGTTWSAAPRPRRPVRRNRQALDSVAFRPRVLRDVSRGGRHGTGGSGSPCPSRSCSPPIGSIEIVRHPAAPPRRRRAPPGFGVPQMLSSACNPGLEATAQAADTLRIFQLYVRGDDGGRRRLGRAARETTTTEAFCLTVDSGVLQPARARPRAPVREALAGRRDGARVPGARSRWDQVKRFKDVHPDLPLVLKGIATAEDADVACRARGGGRVRLEPRRPPARPRPGQSRRAARGRPGRRGPRQGDGSTAASCGARTSSRGIALGAEVVGLGRIACMGLAAAGGIGARPRARAAGGGGAGLPRAPGRQPLRRAGRELSLARDARGPGVRRQRLPPPRPRRRPALILRHGFSVVQRWGGYGEPYGTGLRWSFSSRSRSQSAWAPHCTGVIFSAPPEQTG